MPRSVLPCTGRGAHLLRSVRSPLVHRGLYGAAILLLALALGLGGLESSAAGGAPTIDAPPVTPTPSVVRQDIDLGFRFSGALLVRSGLDPAPSVTTAGSSNVLIELISIHVPPMRR